MHGRSQKVINHIIFDFDGTLADSKQVFLSVYNQIADRHGLKKIDSRNIEHLKSLGIMDRFRVLDTPVYKIPLLTIQFLKLYKKSIHEVTLIEGMLPVLKALNDSGVKLAILSSNAESSIRLFLANNKIDFISKIHCSHRIFGKDKIIKQFLNKNKLRSEEVLYVGDEQRDIIACKKNNVKIIWVKWGFDTEQVAEKESPDFVAVTPDDILIIAGTMPAQG
jgi:phosphoglycolate phosphatase